MGTDKFVKLSVHCDFGGLAISKLCSRSHGGDLFCGSPEKKGYNVGLIFDLRCIRVSGTGRTVWTTDCSLDYIQLCNK